MIRYLVGLVTTLVLIVANVAVVNTASAQIDPNLPIIISDLDWHPDGALIAIGISAHSTEAVCVLDPNIQIVDVASNQRLDFPHTDSTCSVTNVDFSPDGSQLLTTTDSFVELWDVVTGERLQSLLMEGNRFQHAYWRPDGARFLEVSKTGIDVDNPSDFGETFLTLLAPKRLENIFFTDSVWSPDGGSIASSTDDGTIYVWDAANEDILQVFTAHTAPVQHLVWNAAANLIASGDDSGTILVWNPETGELVAQLAGHTDAIRDLDWRLDGQQLASAGADNTLRIWAWSAGDVQIIEDNDSIWALAYNPDGSQLAYGGEFPDAAGVQVEIIDIPLEIDLTSKG